MEQKHYSQIIDTIIENDFKYYDWQKDVICEAFKLSEKLTTLEDYMSLNNSTFYWLKSEDKVLLEKQHSLMQDYLTILISRIERFDINGK